MTDVERGWFTRTLGGTAAPAFYWRADRSGDVDFDVADADVDESFRLWAGALRGPHPSAR